MKMPSITKTRPFWVLMMSSAVLLYLLGLGMLVFPGTRLAGMILLASVLLLHTVEIKTALRIGRECQLSDTRIILMNMLFGFTWWLPLQKGYLS